MYVIRSTTPDINGNVGLVGSVASLVEAWTTCEGLRRSFPHKHYAARDEFGVDVIRTERDMRKPDGWCRRCGAGNDALGFAHLAACPTNT